MYNFGFWISSCCFGKIWRKGERKEAVSVDLKLNFLFQFNSFKVAMFPIQNIRSLLVFGMGSLIEVGEGM
jgi:hypothetical protein